jgi:glycosyltransferase involved in cell wall biosynthesis
LNNLKLAIVSTHPIQYNAPLFKALALEKDIYPRVFYTWSQAAQGPQFDAGFERAIQWDIPLLDGYEHEFVPNVSTHPSPERRDGVVNPTLIAAIESWGADAILVYGWNLSSHLRAMRHFKGRTAVFFRGDSTLLDPQSAWRSVLRRAALHWVYRHIDVALAVGQNSADYFRWCGIPASRIVLAPHSVDNARFADSSGAADAQALRWRSELRIAPDAPVFLFAGKFIDKKDPALLLDAFADIGRAAHLVFVGGGPQERQLRDRAQGRVGVHFMPMQNQAAMPAVYRLGDVFVLPSRGPGETWGLALNEAMASGRAVIAGARVGGARDLVQPAVNGWIFESANRAALTQVLRAAADRGVDGLRSMGRAARTFIAAWSTQIAAAKIGAAVREFSARGRVTLPKH